MSELDKLEKKSPSLLKSFIAGGVGGMALVASGHPLDTIKVLLFSSVLRLQILRFVQLGKVFSSARQSNIKVLLSASYAAGNAVDVLFFAYYSLTSLPKNECCKIEQKARHNGSSSISVDCKGSLLPPQLARCLLFDNIFQKDTTGRT